MDTFELLESAIDRGQRLSRGEVEEVLRNESIVLVRLDAGQGSAFLCDVLQTGERPAALAPCDQVLIWHPGRADERPIVLGRIGPARDCADSRVDSTDADVDAVPAELVLEARKTLTLRVGDGSITIRADGKVLIKGKDLVSHAQRVNRIKGGSVAIN
jgi:hypothetical protein